MLQLDLIGEKKGRTAACCVLRAELIHSVRTRFTVLFRWPTEVRDRGGDQVSATSACSRGARRCFAAGLGWTGDHRRQGSFQRIKQVERGGADGWAKRMGDDTLRTLLAVDLQERAHAGNGA